MESLFVYGTLRKGFPNEHVLTEIGGTFTEASVKGRYIDSGWGAEMGCPGLKLDDAGDMIQGQVFRSENLAQHWQKLDEFEGREYARVETQVQLNDGQFVTAYVYVLV